MTWAAVFRTACGAEQVLPIHSDRGHPPIRYELPLREVLTRVRPEGVPPVCPRSRSFELLTYDFQSARAIYREVV